MNNTTVAIIGGGPAGLIAADFLSAGGKNVVVYDHMPSVGRKFLMAGRGGLNITHSEPVEKLLDRYGDARDNVAEHIKAFDPASVKAWCHGLGQPTFTGSSGRIFPEAMKASPLLRAVLARLQARGVVIKLRHDWQGFGDNDLLLFDAPDGRISVKADATLLALGGASWPKLGSTGTWIQRLRERGIKISPLVPANCALLINWTDYFCEHFAGQPLKNIALQFGSNFVRGEAMITKSGLEGGAVYAISAAVRDACARDGHADLSVDLRPDMPLETVALHLEKRRKAASFATGLRQSLTLTPAAINLLRDVTARALPTDIKALAHLIKNVPIQCHSVAPLDRAISTAGGVLFSECDEHLMLRTMPGVFVAGEMLDWEAPTGGYLLQGVFATGVAAAAGIMRYML